jgi:hypothetical protein
MSISFVNIDSSFLELLPALSFVASEPTNDPAECGVTEKQEKSKEQQRSGEKQPLRHRIRR